MRRRQLGRELRLMRERAGLTLEAAAPELDWSVSKLSRIETAQQSVDVHWVRSMLDLYDVGGDRWTEIIDLTREARQKGWWRMYGLGDDSYVGFETEAAQVREFTLTFVPGLLQTAEYSRALFTDSLIGRSESDLRNLVGIRTIRQQRLTSAENPIELVAVIDESALHRPVGGPSVLKAQLRHLVAAAELRSVTVQVLPTASGAHHPIAGGFIVLSFGDLGEPDLAYIEHSLGALLIEKDADVSRARLLFDRLRSTALGPTASTDLIRQLAEQP